MATNTTFACFCKMLVIMFSLVHVSNAWKLTLDTEQASTGPTNAQFRLICDMAKNIVNIPGVSDMSSNMLTTGTGTTFKYFDNLRPFSMSIVLTNDGTIDATCVHEYRTIRQPTHIRDTVNMLFDFFVDCEHDFSERANTVDEKMRVKTILDETHYSITKLDD